MITDKPAWRLWFSGERVFFVSYIVIALLVLIHRYFVLKAFGFVFMDGDQSIMWYGLKEYAEGNFHEPRFYGQAYNSMLEALFAVPLRWMGMPVYKALPCVTTIFALAPYFIFSFFCFLRKRLLQACMIISIPLLLPAEYALITTLPRGFVPGLFVTSIACIAVFKPRSATWWFLGGLLSVIGFSVNSNAALLSAPCILYLWLGNMKTLRYYLFTGVGLALGLCLHLLVNRFYVTHPYYNLHDYDLLFSFDRLFKSFLNLDKFFNNNSILLWRSGFLNLLYFIPIALLLFRSKKINEGIAVIFIPFMIILTLGINKVHEGVIDIFFPYSRMYLALPLLLGVAVSFIPATAYPAFLRFWVLLPFGYFVFHRDHPGEDIKRNVQGRKAEVVTVAKVEDLLSYCRKLQHVCKKYDVDLVVISFHYFYDSFNYGCPSCLDPFPPTLRPAYERRTWRLLEDEKRIYRNIFIIDMNRDFRAEFGFVKKLPEENDFYLVENNTVPTMELLQQLKIPCRPYK